MQLHQMPDALRLVACTCQIAAAHLEKGAVGVIFGSAGRLADAARQRSQCADESLLDRHPFAASFWKAACMACVTSLSLCSMVGLNHGRAAMLLRPYSSMLPILA